jgi:hypothetical protein
MFYPRETWGARFCNFCSQKAKARALPQKLLISHTFEGTQYTQVFLKVLTGHSSW